jgi:hypothetical protein
VEEPGARDREKNIFNVSQQSGEGRQRANSAELDEETFDCADAAQHRRTHHLAFQRKIRSGQIKKGLPSATLISALCSGRKYLYSVQVLPWPYNATTVV